MDHLEEKPRSHQQREGQRDLRDHQRAVALPRARRRAGAVLERLVEAHRARHANGRQQAEQHRRRSRGQRGEAEHAPAELRPDDAAPPEVLRHTAPQDLDAPDAGRRAERRAGHREQRALDEHLADHGAAAGADGEPQRDLAPLGEAARERQVGEVRAGDEEHGERRAGQGPVDVPEPHRVVAHGPDVEGERRPLRVIGLGQIGRHGLELGVGALAASRPACA